MKRAFLHSIVAVGIGGLSMAPASADNCGLCASEIVINSSLAACFLSEYSRFASKRDGVIVVDLSNCGTDRGVVEALPSPTLKRDEPDVQFILSRGQLDCLKQKLQQPGLVLDPSARIELDRCG